jgi:hypothetical protein
VRYVVSGALLTLGSLGPLMPLRFP